MQRPPEHKLIHWLVLSTNFTERNRFIYLFVFFNRDPKAAAAGAAAQHARHVPVHIHDTCGTNTFRGNWIIGGTAMLWPWSVFWPQKLVSLLRQEFLFSFFFSSKLHRWCVRPLLVVKWIYSHRPKFSLKNKNNNKKVADHQVELPFHQWTDGQSVVLFLEGGNKGSLFKLSMFRFKSGHNIFKSQNSVSHSISFLCHNSNPPLSSHLQNCQMELKRFLWSQNWFQQCLGQFERKVSHLNSSQSKSSFS